MINNHPDRIDPPQSVKKAATVNGVSAAIIRGVGFNSKSDIAQLARVMGKAAEAYNGFTAQQNNINVVWPATDEVMNYAKSQGITFRLVDMQEGPLDQTTFGKAAGNFCADPSTKKIAYVRG